METTKKTKTIQTDLLRLMTDLYKISGIQVLLVSSLSDLEGRIDYDVRHRIFKDFSYSDCLQSFQTTLDPGVLYHIEDDFLLFYTLLPLPESLPSAYRGKYLFFGPVMFDKISEESFRRIVKEKEIPPALVGELNEFYSKIPVFNSFDTWVAFSSVFASHFLMEKDVKSQILRYGLSNTDMFPGYVPPEDSENSELSKRIIESRYEAENQLLQAVSSGNVKEALAAYNCTLSYKIAPRTDDAMRNSKNMHIILNTLLRKAAQCACVHSWYIDRISTYFALQIESANCKEQLKYLPFSMIRRYCLLVRSHSRLQYSIAIRRCLDYIDFHYTDELTLGMLADNCSVSSCYLSSLFRKEVHMTITDYITKTRLEKAAELLNGSTLSIQEIAFVCGFGDPSYFTRKFKRFYKITPSQFSERSHRERLSP